MNGPVAMDLTVYGTGITLLTAFGFAARYEEQLCDLGPWLGRRCRSAFAAISGALNRIPWHRKKGAHATEEAR